MSIGYHHRIALRRRLFTRRRPAITADAVIVGLCVGLLIGYAVDDLVAWYSGARPVFAGAAYAGR